MSLTFIVPLLIFLGLVGFIFFILSQLSKVVKWKSSSSKITVVIISVYILVGLLAMVAMGQQQSALPILSDEELMKISKGEEQINKAYADFIYTDIDEKYVVETWEYELQGDSITIENSSEKSEYSSEFVVQRSEEEGRAIYVTYYRTPHIIRGMDVTKYVKTPIVSFEQDTLSVTRGDGVELQFYQVMPEMEIMDFKYYRYEMMSLRDRDYGRQVLYLNIPKDVHIID
ncbi:hypothetical protein [Lysinibacillus sp. 54212]|uniref:hypothetical protein n=1 Tax=Lysinibacillus sp. 54212 TaxID=3119829 RepID=UPI002FC5EC30